MSEKLQSIDITQIGVVQEAFFPTTIYYKDLPNGTTINESILSKIYAWAEEDEIGITRSNVKSVGSWHSKTDMNQPEEYFPLVEEVLAMAQAVGQSKGYDANYPLQLDNMWANIHPRYGFNRSHVHPGSLWSGCYYVQTPPGSGRINFSDPRAQAWVHSARYQPDTNRMSTEWSEVYYEAIAGRILLFPAWLRHEVEPNLCEYTGREGDRISVAFNLSQYKISN